MDGLECILVRLPARSLLDRVMPSHIDPDKCSGCRTCEPLCPSDCLHFDADRGVMKVNPFSCKGCGTCVAVCPSGVPVQVSLTDASVLANLGLAIRNWGDGPEDGDEYKAAFDNADRRTAMIKLFSEDEVEPGLVLAAFESGFDGVVLAGPVGTAPEKGHRDRVAGTAKRMLSVLGIAHNRVAVAPDNEAELGAFVKSFAAELTGLGPTPIRLEVSS